MLKIASACVTALVLALYGLLAVRTAEFALLSPRGGILTLGISLVLANVAVWASRHPQRTLSERFQLVVAGWLWLLVQLSGTLYVLARTT